MTSTEILSSYFGNEHILQSPEWGEFKTLIGSRAMRVGQQQTTLHNLPLNWKIGYSPKIRPKDLDLGKLYEAGRQENCIFIKIDVPHAPSEFKTQNSKLKIVEGKSIFARSTILMDLTLDNNELLSRMHEKTRYNLHLSQKKGVKTETCTQVRTPEEKTALSEFIRLQKETAQRQRFFIHPDHYYQTCFETLSAKGMSYLLSAKVSGETAASWILFRYGDVLYYPYGESNYKFRSFMPSNLLMWEAIQLGKKLGCRVFDLWGAADNPNDENDPWHGFTRFKMSFGGQYVRLASTHDLIINDPLYRLFKIADGLRWRVLRSFRK